MSVVILAVGLFSVGLYGVLTRRDLIAILASVEVMLGSATMLLVGLAAASGPIGEHQGAVEATGVLVVAIAAAEAAIGLALVMSVARRFQSTRADELTEVKG
ncbi:MAG: NADH-quinone oxidoreductase subunit NuoK [Coriobacteriia bacterium]|nr:NADH-quinone oxidoreductase subunit NuoK [Coriobacteriia bacterium]